MIVVFPQAQYNEEMTDTRSLRQKVNRATDLENVTVR